MSIYPDWLDEEFGMAEVDGSADIDLDVEGYVFDFSKEYTRTTMSGKSVRSDAHQAYLFWVWKCLHTERFKYPIYSTDFGVEIEAIMERGYDRAVTESEIERTIKEALGIDERTIEARNFSFTWELDGVEVEFELESIYSTDIISFRREG